VAYRRHMPGCSLEVHLSLAARHASQAYVMRGLESDSDSASMVVV